MDIKNIKNEVCMKKLHNFEILKFNTCMRLAHDLLEVSYIAPHRVGHAHLRSHIDHVRGAYGPCAFCIPRFQPINNSSMFIHSTHKSKSLSQFLLLLSEFSLVFRVFLLVLKSLGVRHLAASKSESCQCNFWFSLKPL